MLQRRPGREERKEEKEADFILKSNNPHTDGWGTKQITLTIEHPHPIFCFAEEAFEEKNTRGFFSCFSDVERGDQIIIKTHEIRKTVFRRRTFCYHIRNLKTLIRSNFSDLGKIFDFDGKLGILGGRAPCRGGGSLTISCREGLCRKTGSWGYLEVGRCVEGGAPLLFLAEEAGRSGRRRRRRRT